MRAKINGNIEKRNNDAYKKSQQQVIAIILVKFSISKRKVIISIQNG